MGAVAFAAKFIAALDEAPDDERERALAMVRAAFPEPTARPPALTPAERASRYRERRHETSRSAVTERDEPSRNVTPLRHETSRSSVTERDVLRDASRDGGEGGVSLSSQLLSHSEQISESNVPVAERAHEERPSETRLNPAALVSYFAAGVNEAGATWPEPTGKPFRDLSRALELHARAGPGAPLAVCKALGARWHRHCDGAPRDAFRAAAWLGEGAPERVMGGPRRPRDVKQANPAEAPWLVEPPPIAAEGGGP